MKKKIKWGILGPGRIAHKFAQSVKCIEDARFLVQRNSGPVIAKVDERIIQVEPREGCVVRQIVRKLNALVPIYYVCMIACGIVL